MAASGTGPLIIIDDITHDGGNKFNPGLYKHKHSIDTSWGKLRQQDNDPKHSPYNLVIGEKI